MLRVNFGRIFKYLATNTVKTPIILGTLLTLTSLALLIILFPKGGRIQTGARGPARFCNFSFFLFQRQADTWRRNARFDLQERALATHSMVLGVEAVVEAVEVVRVVGIFGYRGIRLVRYM